MYVVKQGGRYDYEYKEIYLDTASELNNLQLESAAPGSIVYIIENGKVYILNSAKEWVEQ